MLHKHVHLHNVLKCIYRDIYTYMHSMYSIHGVKAVMQRHLLRTYAHNKAANSITNPQSYHIPSSHSYPRSPLNAAKPGALRSLGRRYGNTLTLGPLW